jgi:hypothetical protein
MRRLMLRAALCKSGRAISYGHPSTAGEGLAVCPLGCEGPVEAFDFPVQPGAVGLNELPPGLKVRNGSLERGGVAVGEGVVGDDAIDSRDAVSGEMCGGALEEPGHGCALLVGMDTGVGEAGVVIDCGVDLVEPDRGFPIASVRGADVNTAPAVGDAAQLLGVDMDQVAGMGMLVSILGRRACAEGISGDGVGPRQYRNLVAGQDAADGPGWDTSRC